ncbi:hypothetical protein K438DRAFT_1887729, partial [Mycena galopus ATCC 62051]
MESFNANITLGALQIRTLVSYVLVGLTIAQTYTYYSRFPDDPRLLKALIAFVCVCEIAATMCVGHILYTFTISDFTQPELLIGSPPPKSLPMAVLFSGFTNACVHGFFGFRIYAFTKQMFIPAIIWFASLVLLVLRIVFFVTSLQTPLYATYLIPWEWLLTLVWARVATDVIITTTLVIVLYKERSHAHQKTVALLDKLIVWTIETGMLTSIASILQLATFVTMKSNFIWMMFYTMDAQLFVNSLLASLNSRTVLRTMKESSMSWTAS